MIEQYGHVRQSKRRDHDALELWLGAAIAMRASGQIDHADYLERMAALVICFRGFDEIARIGYKDDAGKALAE